jgi:myo-inositol-1(or 4)-monophosphatase
MLKFAIETAEKAGHYLAHRERKSLNVEHKGRIDLVTDADKISQEIIVGEIEKKYPGHSIIAEEGMEKAGEEGYVWYIDPIDGTTNFVHGVPMYCVSIALYKNRTPVVGVCYNPITKEMFYAEKNKGAFLNGEKITVSRSAKMIDALVVTGFPYKSTEMDNIIKVFFKVIGQVQGIRRFGSAALDLCFVACGRVDAYWEICLKPWDIAAGALILKEAGGSVTCTDGVDFDPDKGNIAASNELLHKELLELIKI